MRWVCRCCSAMQCDLSSIVIILCPLVEQQLQQPPGLTTGALPVNKPETTAVMIIARWPQVSHTAFSYSTYSRWHVIGYRWSSASLWLVKVYNNLVSRLSCDCDIWVIDGEAFRAVWLVSNVSRYLFYLYPWWADRRHLGHGLRFSDCGCSRWPNHVANSNAHRQDCTAQSSGYRHLYIQNSSTNIDYTPRVVRHFGYGGPHSFHPQRGGPLSRRYLNVNESL